MRSFKGGPIQDQFTDMLLSSQWKYDLRCRLAGLCWHRAGVPSKKLVRSTGALKTLSRCEHCLERARSAQQTRRDRLKAAAPAPSRVKVRKVPHPKSPRGILIGAQYQSRSRYFAMVGMRKQMS